MLFRFVVALLLSCAAAADAAGPPFVTVVITQAVAKKSLGTLDAGDAAVVVGAIKNAGAAQPVSHTLGFRAGAASIRVATAWRLGTAIRLVGVNIDLVDATNTLLATDSFAGVTDGYALSTLTFSGLVPGQKYRVILTGSQTAAVSYTMAIE